MLLVSELNGGQNPNQLAKPVFLLRDELSESTVQGFLGDWLDL
jgi:hypothetical protein